METCDKVLKTKLSMIQCFYNIIKLYFQIILIYYIKNSIKFLIMIILKIQKHKTRLSWGNVFLKWLLSILMNEKVLQNLFIPYLIFYLLNVILATINVFPYFKRFIKYKTYVKW